MNNKVVFQAFTFSEILTDLEILCIKSLLHLGYEIHLYTYYYIKLVPEGVSLKYAGQIMMPQDIFADEDGSFQTFYELFKFKLLHQCGGWWIDLDIIILKPIDVSHPYQFSSNYTEDLSTISINSKLLRVPQMDSFTDGMLGDIHLLKKNELTARRIRVIFIKKIFKHHLQKFIQTPDRYFPFLEIKGLDFLKSTPSIEGYYAITLWKDHWPKTGLANKLIDRAWVDLLKKALTSVKDIDYCEPENSILRKMNKPEEPVVVIIHADIQSPEDATYYRSLLVLLKSFPMVSVYLLECGFKSVLEQHHVAYYLFTKKTSENQNQNFSINEILNSITDKVVCLWLSKCYISKKQFVTGVKFIIDYNMDICFPYNEIFFIDDILCYVFEKEFDFNFLKEACSRIYRRNNNLFEGGVFFVNRESYVKHSAENTNLSTPVFSDIDRILRIKNDGRITFLRGPLYSLVTTGRFKVRQFENLVIEDYLTTTVNIANSQKK